VPHACHVPHDARVGRGQTGVRGICIHVSTQIRKNGVLTTLHI